MTMVPVATIAVIMAFSAFKVVTAKNLVHCVFWLAAVLIATAASFVMLHAPFLAGIQIVLYTGGVITLMLFGVMLTQRGHETTLPNPSEHHPIAAICAGALFALMISAIWAEPIAVQEVIDPTAKAIGGLILKTHVIAFEVLSILLLAGMIGAIVLARRTDP